MYLRSETWVSYHFVHPLRFPVRGVRIGRTGRGARAKLSGIRELCVVVFTLHTPLLISSVLTSGFRSLTMKPPEVFGESSLHSEDDLRVRQATVAAVGDSGSTVMSWQVASIEALVGFGLQEERCVHHLLPITHHQQPTRRKAQRAQIVPAQRAQVVPAIVRPAPSTITHRPPPRHYPPRSFRMFNRKLLASVKYGTRSLTEGMDMKQLDWLVESLAEQTYKVKETVVPEGGLDEKLYIVKRGEAAVTSKSSGEAHILKAGMGSLGSNFTHVPSTTCHQLPLNSNSPTNDSHLE